MIMILALMALIVMLCVEPTTIIDIMKIIEEKNEYG